MARRERSIHLISLDLITCRQVQVQVGSFFPDPGTPPRCPRVAPASCNRLSPRLSAKKIGSTSSSPPVHRVQPAVQVHDPVSRRTQQKPRTQQRAVYSYTLHRTEQTLPEGDLFSPIVVGETERVEWGWWRGGGEGSLTFIFYDTVNVHRARESAAT